jgi:ribosomal-protein-alanine N-acetyltransferase
MKIETDRLILRKPTIKDADDLIESGNDYEIHYNSFFLMKFPFGKKEAIGVINEKTKNLKRFAIELKNSNKVIGLVDLYNINEAPALHSGQSQESSPEGGKLKLGYWIGQKYRRVGFANEAVKAIIKYAFENFKIEKIIATTLVNNLASQKFLEKLEFKKQKVLPKDRFLDGEYVDSVQYVLEKNKLKKDAKLRIIEGS